MPLFENNSRQLIFRILAVILAIIISRLSSIVILENFNIINDSGLAIKFGGLPAFLDYEIYKNQIPNPWSEITRPFKFLYLLLADWHKALIWLKEQPLKLGQFIQCFWELQVLKMTGIYCHGYT
jgi:hypothetical protein